MPTTVPAALGTARLPVLASKIHAELQAADADWQSALGHAIKAGELLIEAKAQVRHGQWLPWLEANFEFTRQTASGYMRAAERKDEMEGSPSISLEAALKSLAKPREDLDRLQSARWELWQAEWASIAGVVPPTPEDLAAKVFGGEDALATLLRKVAPLELDDKEIVEAHKDLMLEDAARVLLVKNGKHVPPPPTWFADPPSKNGRPLDRVSLRPPHFTGSSKVRRATEAWDRFAEMTAGRWLGEADLCGLGDCWPPSLDPDDVDVPGARAVFAQDPDEAEFAEGRSDSEIRQWVIGRAWTRIGPKFVAA
jgi:hypothetical protein